VALSDDERAILTGGNLGHLATLRRDGSPHVTPVWVDVDGDDVLVNTADGRDKANHVRRDARVALSVADRTTDYRAVWLGGQVVDITTDGAREHANRMTQRYLGQDTYPGPADEVRIILRIRPDGVHSIIT